MKYILPAVILFVILIALAVFSHDTEAKPPAGCVLHDHDPTENVQLIYMCTEPPYTRQP